MNSVKMTIEQFRTIKNKLFEIAEAAEKQYEQEKDNPGFDSDAAEQELLNQYLQFQGQLLSYDLSDIPFEEWKDMEIVSDETHSVDFSKTGANIDFDLVNYYGNGNFRGCNIRNLDKLRNLHPSEFDEQTIKSNASLFLSDMFSDDFKKKYYENTLSVADFVNLTETQLLELKQKKSQTI